MLLSLVSMMITMVMQKMAMNAAQNANNPMSPGGGVQQPPVNTQPASGGQPLPGTDGKPGYKAKATSYYPANDPVEGGYNDMRGKPLHTLQDFLDGKAPYVSVAMDNKNSFPYGTKLRIPELEKKYGKQIEFRVVDTGGDFYGKGKSRIDICSRSQSTSLDASLNGTLTLIPV
jgi:3D (Asp-Asp-Asp) domain-containing protein